MSHHQVISLCVFFGGIALLFAGEIGYDVWVVRQWGAQDTISDAMHAAPRIIVGAFCALAYGTIGFLTAHFWWGAN